MMRNGQLSAPLPEHMRPALSPDNIAALEAWRYIATLGAGSLPAVADYFAIDDGADLMERLHVIKEALS